MAGLLHFPALFRPGFTTSLLLFFQMVNDKSKNSKVKLEDTFSNNPWCVDDASAFLKFCCPECDYQIPDLQMFSDHALDNHAKSLALFGAEKETEETHIKEENMEIEYNDEIQIPKLAYLYIKNT